MGGARRGLAEGPVSVNELDSISLVGDSSDCLEWQLKRAGFKRNTIQKGLAIKSLSAEGIFHRRASLQMFSKAGKVFADDYKV